MNITLTDSDVIAAIRAAADQDNVTPGRVVQECLQYMARTGQVILSGHQAPLEPLDEVVCLGPVTHANDGYELGQDRPPDGTQTPEQLAEVVSHKPLAKVTPFMPPDECS